MSNGLSLRFINSSPDYLAVFDASTTTVLATTGDLFASYTPGIAGIIASCGEWLFVYSDEPANEQKITFSEGSTYVYDTETSEIILYTFRCQPRPNDCDEDGNFVVDDGIVVAIDNGGEFSCLHLIGLISFSFANS